MTSQSFTAYLKRKILYIFLRFAPTNRKTIELFTLLGLDSESFYLYKIMIASTDPVVQVGANDGLMCDPISRFIELKTQQKFFRIEPHPHYFKRLVSNHTTNPNVTCLNCALTDDELCRERDLFYIPAKVADEMNGENLYTQNDWAHGQGSFYRDIVVQNILANSFRGPHYESSIPYYISSISSITVPTYTFNQLSTLLGLQRVHLLLLDVQGAEFSILSALGDIRPRFIVYEHDLEREDRCAKLLEILGYIPISVDGINKIYRSY